MGVLLSLNVCSKRKEKILPYYADIHIEEYTKTLKANQREIINAKRERGEEIPNLNSDFIRFRLEPVKKIVRQMIPVEKLLYSLIYLFRKSLHSEVYV